MTLKAGGMFVVAALATWGCAPRAAQEERAELSGEAARYVLKSLPKEVGQRSLIDFGGKVHLVGYTLPADTVARPGSRVKLTLYWLSVAPLEEGWAPVTQILDGKRVIDVPGNSALRQQAALAPSAWQPGLIYVDEQDVQIPRDVEGDAVTFSVGFVRQAPAAEPLAKPDEAKADNKDEANESEGASEEAERADLRLPILSGPSDGSERGLLGVLRTGMTAERRAQLRASKNQGTARTGADGATKRQAPRGMGSAR